MDSVKSEFEYFKPDLFSTQVEKVQLREYTPISAIQHHAPIEFMVPGTDQIYLDLTRSFLYICAKITAPDGTNLLNATSAAPINLPVHSMFSNVDVELNGKCISDPNGLYPYRAYIETLLSYSKDAQENFLQTALWFKDTAGSMDVCDLAGNGATNKGLICRAKYFDSSKEVEMLARLHVDIFHQPLAIPQNVSIKIKLTPSKDSFLVMSAANVNVENPQILYHYRVTDARFFVRSLHVSAASVIAHEKVLTMRNMRFPIRRVTMKHMAIPHGQTSILHDNIYLGQIPRRIVIGIMSDAAMVGSYKLNPFNFYHHNVNFIVLYVNGETVPVKAYQPNFGNAHYLLDYLSVFQGTDTLFSNRDLNISREEFGAGYALWVFDLSNDLAANNCASIPRSGSVRLEIKFSQATEETLNVICYAEFDSAIELDKFKNIIAPGY